MSYNIHATLKCFAWGILLFCSIMQPFPEDMPSPAFCKRCNLQGLLHDLGWWSWLESCCSPAMQVTSDINAEVDSQNRHLDNLVRGMLAVPCMILTCTALLVEGEPVNFSRVRRRCSSFGLSGYCNCPSA